MDKEKLIKFAGEQCKIFPEDSEMGKYLRETMKMLQESPCEDAPDTNVGSKKQAEPCEDAVSRKAAKDKLKAICKKYCISYEDGERKPSTGGSAFALGHAFDDLPPVTPTQRWIPVSERLPKPYTFVNATCRSLVDDRENWVVETIYLPIPKEVNEQGYSDWGNIPMLNWGKAEVIAWMQRDIPKPYKVEMEGE